MFELTQLHTHASSPTIYKVVQNKTNNHFDSCSTRLSGDLLIPTVTKALSLHVQSCCLLLSQVHRQTSILIFAGDNAALLSRALFTECETNLFAASWNLRPCSATLYSLGPHFQFANKTPRTEIKQKEL